VPTLAEGQVRVIKGTSSDEVEGRANDFLTGDGSVQNPRKILTQPAQLVINSTDFYLVLVFKKANDREVNG